MSRSRKDRFLDSLRRHINVDVDAYRTSSPTDCQEVPEMDNDPQYPAEGLCDDCASIDWDHWFNQKMDKDKLYSVRELKRFDESWEDRFCPLCRFLFNIWKGSDSLHKFGDRFSVGLMSTLNYHRYHLFGAGSTTLRTKADVTLIIYSTLHSPESIIDSTSGHIQWICSHQGLAISSDDNVEGAKVRGHSISPDSVDFTRVVSWMRHCTSHHSATCRLEQHSTLPHFKLLDCETQELVSCDLNESYSALSYVWGSTYNSDRVGSTERTIKDAMYVTRQLGLRYIWVDRHCIPQGDEEARHIQLRGMDLIYASAKITIVAACGENAESGLCGISAARSTQPTIKIGNRTLVSTFQSPSNFVRTSGKCTWNKRGWTYQEAALSRQCLYFTPQQVYFECRAGSFQESIEDLQAMTSLDSCVQNLGKSHAGYRIHPPDFFDHLHNNPKHIYDSIKEYAMRSLTFQEDKLYAFLGILSRYKHPRFEISWIWGIPILSHWKESTFQEGFAAGLCWTTSPATRTMEASFPTWSWIAWDHTITTFEHASEGIICTPKLNFNFETTTGRMIQWKDTRKHFDIRGLSRFMHVESWVMSCDLIWMKSSDVAKSTQPYALLSGGRTAYVALALINDAEIENEYKAEGRDRDSMNVSWQGTAEGIDPLQKVPCEVLILGDIGKVRCDPSDRTFLNRRKGCNPCKRPFLMIIRSRGDYYERVGCVDISNTSVAQIRGWGKDVDITQAFTNAEWKTIRLG